jgi:hypothetical protein
LIFSYYFIFRTGNNIMYMNKNKLVVAVVTIAAVLSAPQAMAQFGKMLGGAGPAAAPLQQTRMPSSSRLKSLRH